MSKLNLERIELSEIEMPLKAPFRTSFGTSLKRRILLVRVFDRDGAWGIGECTAPEEPFFNHETIDTAWIIIRDFVAPILKEFPHISAADVETHLGPIRGNRMAIGGVEAAVWELEARKLGIPLWQHLGGTQTTTNCGVSIGLQESPDILLEKVTREVESGYQRIKLKIMPGEDVVLVEKIRSHFPEIMLSVDANSAYRLDSAVELFKKLDSYGLLMVEQPLTAGDLLDHAKLQRQINTRICLDESITSIKDAKDAIELGSCQIINIKLGRVGGHSQARAVQEVAARNGIPVWCGGMLESGIGRAHNIAMSTLPGFTLPGDVSASSRYWEEDIIDPPVLVSPAGTISVSNKPGLGFEIKEDLIEHLTVRRETIAV